MGGGGTGGREGRGEEDNHRKLLLSILSNQRAAREKGEEVEGGGPSNECTEEKSANRNGKDAYHPALAGSPHNSIGVLYPQIGESPMKPTPTPDTNCSAVKAEC